MTPGDPGAPKDRLLHVVCFVFAILPKKIFVRWFSDPAQMAHTDKGFNKLCDIHRKRLCSCPSVVFASLLRLCAVARIPVPTTTKKNTHTHTDQLFIPPLQTVIKLLSVPSLFTRSLLTLDSLQVVASGSPLFSISRPFPSSIPHVVHYPTSHVQPNSYIWPQFPSHAPPAPKCGPSSHAPCPVVPAVSLVRFPLLYLLSGSPSCISCPFPLLHLLSGSPFSISCPVPPPVSLVRFPLLHLLSGSLSCISCPVPPPVSLVPPPVSLVRFPLLYLLSGSPFSISCPVPPFLSLVRFPLLHLLSGLPSHARDISVPLLMRCER